MNRRTGPTQRKAVPADPLEDAVSSVVRYARQETVGPLRGAGRWLVFGLFGAIMVGAATVMGVLAALRLVQDLGGGALDGAWSFVPYLVAFVAAVFLTAVSLSRIGGSELNKRAFEEVDHG